MPDKAQVLTEFFSKVQADEKILRSKFPQISGLLQVGSVPAAVLQNYMVARTDVQARMAFSRDLMRQYSDPQTGQRSPDPLPLPAFGVSSSGLQGDGDMSQALATLRSLAPTTLVSGKQVVFDAPPVPAEPQQQLGNPIVIIAVIGGLLVITSITAKFIIDAANEQQVKLAEQAVELEKQKNFARIWDTAQTLIAKCVGTNPTPDVIGKCWEDVATRFPAIVAAIPEHKLSAGSGMGFFGKIGLAAAVVGVGVAGVWGYRKWRDSKEAHDARDEDRKFKREEHAQKMAAAPQTHGTWMAGAAPKGARRRRPKLQSHG